MKIRAMTPLNTLIANRYRIIDKLGAGGMGIVYHAFDKLEGEDVALKQVLVDTDQLLFTTLNTESDAKVALAQEFRTLASLRHPNIISVLDYGFSENGHPFFTMNLLQNAVTLIEAGQDLSLKQQVELIIPVLQALTYLHRRGIIHRDLKPGNILVVNQQPKVVDFGLAINRGKVKTGDELVGTIYYMAPELLAGLSPHEASDLYAIGIMCYELFLGKMPFSIGNVSKTIQEIMNLSMNADSWDLPPALSMVLQKLIMRDPEQRYNKASDVITALSEAVGIPTPRETIAIRESFLQAADFVGREKEMSQVSDTLTAALDQKGSMLFIGGESGVGKSRLLDEVRALALVRGFSVLHGQNVSEGSKPYQTWRNVLRNILLFTEVSPFEASVLKPLIPDIEQILEQPVADAPEVDPQATHDRLVSVIESVFVRQQKPLLVVLEDMQWASNESISVLSRLYTQGKHIPVVFLGSYRDDEDTRWLEKFPHVPRIKLQRLNENDTARLSQSILGEAGHEPHLVRFLQNETEGNVFFLIEVVRSLAEDLDQLENISSRTLPAHLFAGGVSNVIRRRLERVPAHGQHLLKVAAILGRELDLKLLQPLSTEIDFEEWLNICSSASILDAFENRWRFAHDKLREYLLNNLDEQERQKLHQVAAETIENIYGDSPDVVAALAYHWEQAHIAAKAALYLEKAGEQALKSSAYDKAITLLKRAADLDDGKHHDQLRLARRNRLIGEAYYNIGHIYDSSHYLETALKYLGIPVAPQKWQVGTAISGEFLKQSIRRFFGGRITRRNSLSPSYLLESMKVVYLLTSVQFIGGDLLRWAYVTVRWLNIAEASDLTPEIQEGISFIYGIMSTITGSIPFHLAARNYRKLAFETAKSANPEALAVVQNYTGIYTLGLGEWDVVEDLFTQSRTFYESIGHPRRWEELTIFLAFTHYYRGNFRTAYQLWEENYRSAFLRGDNQMQYPALIGRAQCLMRLNTPDVVERVTEFMDTVDTFLFAEGRQTNNAELSNYHAVVAARDLRRGDIDATWKAADRSIHFTRQLLFEVKALVQEPYDRLPEIYITLWMMDKKAPCLSPQQREQVSGLAKESIDLLQKYAKTIVFAQPRELLWRGWYHWLADNPSKAEEYWRKSLASAERLQMPYDVSRAYYALGNLKEEYTQKARQMMQAQGIRYMEEQLP